MHRIPAVLTGSEPVNFNDVNDDPEPVTQRMPRMPQWVELTGDTFPVRAAIARLGCRWDGAAKVWRAPADVAGEAQRLIPPARPRAAAPATVAITGKTFPVRERLKALGGRWDAGAECWRVPADRAAEAQRIVDAQAPARRARSARFAPRGSCPRCGCTDCNGPCRGPEFDPCFDCR